jgi:hypothetical protein
MTPELGEAFLEEFCTDLELLQKLLRAKERQTASPPDEVLFVQPLVGMFLTSLAARVNPDLRLVKGDDDRYELQTAVHFKPATATGPPQQVVATGFTDWLVVDSGSPTIRLCEVKAFMRGLYHSGAFAEKEQLLFQIFAACNPLRAQQRTTRRVKPPTLGLLCDGFCAAFAFHIPGTGEYYCSGRTSSLRGFVLYALLWLGAISALDLNALMETARRNDFREGELTTVALDAENYLF